MMSNAYKIRMHRSRCSFTRSIAADGRELDRKVIEGVAANMEHVEFVTLAFHRA
jgi:hypothetical protein